MISGGTSGAPVAADRSDWEGLARSATASRAGREGPDQTAEDLGRNPGTAVVLVFILFHRASSSLLARRLPKTLIRTNISIKIVINARCSSAEGRILFTEVWVIPGHFNVGSIIH